MIPPSDTPPAGQPPSRSDLRWLLLFAGGMAVAGAACWLAWPLAATAYRGWRTHQHLSAAQEQMAGQKWAAAAGSLREARKLAPEDPDVLHASLDLLQRAGRDPRGAVSLVEQLQQTGHATPADLIVMARMRVLLGEAGQAQKVFDRLPTAERESAAGKELLADLLLAQGQRARANAIRREILRGRTDDPASLRQLALLEMNEGTPEERKAMRAQLWQHVRAAGPTRLAALDLLSRDRLLTSPQVEELRQILTLIPAGSTTEEVDTARLRVLSAQIRVSPQWREDHIGEEILRWQNRPPAQTRPLVAWLAEEGEHARLLRIVPPAMAAKFTDILPYYVEALRKTGRWRELATFLDSGGIDPAFSKTEKLLWQTEARAMLDGDPARARQMLARLMEDGGRGDGRALILKAGELAERLGWWDLAQRCFAAMADKHPSVRPAMLVKVYEMAERQHDGPAMLHACERLSTLHPDNASVLAQKIYLQLLLGIDLETAGSQMARLAGGGAPERAGQRHLITALLAYRQGRREGVREMLSQILDPSALSAGERAVYAGLLKSAGGDPAAAFRIIEKISPALLLPEEKKFAQRGL